MVRLTKENLAKVLKLNEGFNWVTVNDAGAGRSFNRNTYNIRDGKLFRRSEGRTSWSDSKYDEEVECDPEQTRRFLRKVRNWIKFDI